MKTHNSFHTDSYRIALGGIIAALCVVCMFLTGVFPMFYLILPMLASALIYVMVIETGIGWGWMTYLSVGFLSFFITPNKDATLVFMLFFGYYPLLRARTNRTHWKVLTWILRLLIFNAAVLAFVGISIYLLGMEELLESMGDYGKYGGLILWGMANVMFLCYDFSMGNFPMLYRQYLKPRISPTPKAP